MSSIAGRHDLHAQTMLFEQVAKPQNGRFIRQAAGARVKVCELAIQLRSALINTQVVSHTLDNWE